MKIETENDETNNVVTLDFAPEFKRANPDKVRAVYAERDARRIAEAIEPVRDTHMAFVQVPRGTPITIIERDDDGPWWSAIVGAVGLNALVWLLAMIISK